MSNLDVLGISEIRRHVEKTTPQSAPRRKKLLLMGAILTDHPKKTLVLPGQLTAMHGPEGELGIDTPPTTSWTDPETSGTTYYYDERGGEWFGLTQEFSGIDAVYVTTKLASPADMIVVQGFLPTPAVPRKVLFNFGPGAIALGGRDWDSAPTGQLRGDLLTIAPQDSVRIFWDPIDQCWRYLSRLQLTLDETPAGQIVIQGVPVMIQGRPLVNTVPGLARRRAPKTPATAPADSASLPPTAEPEVVIATIVERPQALPPAPRALPRAADSVELETTFADSSLEMTELGDKFRVAESLQRAVEAIRLPFTLRTTSVDNPSFEEIGVLRLDATPLGATFELVAELEVAAPGQTVELQLYNLTAATVVATLSSIALTTTKRSAAVTLPAGEQLYSVQLRRIGGAPGQRVSCRSVYLEQLEDA